MSFIFLRNRVTGGAAFSPASLFASGEEGAWYEPSTTTCFTDTAGTTAATYGDAVARINDLSGNGNHATQATAAARPILARVPEGGRRNELSETDTLATQSVTVTAAERTLSFTGTGTVTLTGASTAGPLVGTGAGDRVSLTFTPSAGSLTLTVLGTVTDAQLELGASATTYQSVADSLGYDITEAGVTSLEYLAFDGSDDIFQVAYGSTFANITRGVAYQCGGQNFICDDNDTVNAAGLYSIADGNLRWGVNNAAGANAITGVGGWGRGSPEIAVATASSSQEITLAGSGNSASGTAASAPAGITGVTLGAAANGSLKLSGRIYAFVDVDRVITAGENTNLQNYLAAKSGVTL